MPDPTPTPDTLRAAAQAVVDRWHMDLDPQGFPSAVADLRAALAASPAPTDTPDERRGCRAFVGPPNRISWHCTLADGHPGNHEQRDGDDEVERSWPSGRPAAVTAPREDERAGGPCPATCRLIQVHRHCPGDCSCVTFPYTEDRWPDAARWSASEVRP